MKILFKGIIVIMFLGISAACNNMNDNGNQLDNNETNKPLDDRTELNDDKKNNTNDAVQEPNDSMLEPNDSKSEPKSTDQIPDTENEKVVIENEAFKIFEPSPETVAEDRIVVRGLARVFEGTVQYEFEDGHFILAQGYTTASEGAPGWGDFNITIELNDATDGSYRIVLYEKSAKDGAHINELIIPVYVGN